MPTLYDHKLERLQSILQERGMDCLALIAGINLRYMTGLEFHLMERAVIVFYPANGKPVFVVPFLERLKVEKGAPYSDFDIYTYKDGEDPANAVGQAVMALPEIQRIAVEFLTMRVHEMKLVQRHTPMAFMENADPIMDVLRLVKSGQEVENIRAAIEISQQALDEVVAQVRPGMTEYQVANMLTMAQLQRGGGVVPFEPLVQAGANAADPHGGPGQRDIQAGQVLLIDFGTTSAGYASDITRTFFVGEPTGKIREVYDVVLRANRAALAVAKPGLPAREVDRAARDVIEAAGYGKYFVHRTGHGLGMGAHESPSVDESNDTPLEVGNVFTIEPGIYIPGQFGVRIEDNVLITEEGAISLTDYPREVRIIGDT